MQRKLFKDSIGFSCTACGKCCKSRHGINVFLNRSEIADIASYLDVPESEFLLKYTDTKSHNQIDLVSLKSHFSKKQCIFLESSNKCSIYPVRPTQCRTYPYWPNIMSGSAEWKAEMRYCEGMTFNNAIKNNNKFSKGDGDNKEPEGDTATINTIVHQLHARGTGEEWLYGEAMDLLSTSAELTPELIAEFDEEFYQLHGSDTAYESEHLRVVDFNSIDPPPVYPTNWTCTEQYERSNTNVTDMLDNDVTEQQVFRRRRLEFVSSPTIEQTAMSFNGLGMLNYLQLELPVHSLIAAVVDSFIVYKLCKCNTAVDTENAVRVAVIGGGCCALPAYLLSRNYVSELHSKGALSQSVSVTVDVVEPFQEVLDVADEYFGINSFPAAQLQRYVMDGREFLNLNRFHGFDVVIIDAYMDEPKDETENIEVVGRAPPSSMLSDWGLIADALVSAKISIMVLNIWGNNEWRDEVLKSIEQSKYFCRPRIVNASNTTRNKSNIGDSSSEKNVVVITSPIESQDSFNKFISSRTI